MKMKIYILLFLLVALNSVYAQVGIGTTSPNGALDINSTTNGVVVPNIALTSRLIAAPVVNPNGGGAPLAGTLVWNNQTTGVSPNNVVPGFYYWDGVAWIAIAGDGGKNWTTTGNAGTSATTNFVGTTDNIDLVFKRNNFRAGYIGNPAYDINFDFINGNTSFGANSLLNPTFNFGTQSGVRNTAFGVNVMPGITSGKLNTGIGEFALFSNTSGATNTAIGSGSLFSNSIGNNNVAIGRQSLTTSNSDNNTAVGFASLRQNVSGTNNTAIGYEALRGVLGSGNVGVGYLAGRLETGSNKLYIENSNADANNALIYGDFGTSPKILRTNGQLQIGNPSVTGYAFPVNRGLGGQVLQTNGSGATAWVPATSLSITEADPQVSSSSFNYIPKWNGTTLTDGVIYDDGTNVGVGIVPTANNKLEINGKTKTADFQMTNGANANYVLQSDATGNSTWVNASTLTITETDPQVTSTTSNVVPKWNGTTLVDGVMTDNGTNVGVGISPSAGNKLEVNGKTKTADFQMTNGANANYVLQSDVTGNSTWVDASTLTITETDPQVASTTSNVVPKWNGTNLVDGVMIDNGTNIGVGISPSAGNKLEVNGKTKTTNFQMTNGATNNYFLQTDASGNGSWATIPVNTILPYTTTGAATGIYFIALTEYTIRVFNGVSEVRLPDATVNTGIVFIVIGSNGIGSKTFSTAGGVIYDDVFNANITVINTNERYTVQSDGTDWIVIGR